MLALVGAMVASASAAGGHVMNKVNGRISATVAQQNTMNAALDNLLTFNKVNRSQLYTTVADRQSESAPLKMAKSHKVSSIKELCGNYQAEDGWEWLMAEQYKPYDVFATVSDAGNGDVWLGISPCGSYPLKAHVDLQKGTLTITRAENNHLVEDSGDVLGIELYDVMTSGNLVDIDQAVATIGEDGTIDFGNAAIVYAWLGTDYVEAAYTALRFKPINLFVWVDSEWENVGIAQYKDNYFAKQYIDGNVPAVDVALYRNKENNKMFAVKNPYAGFWVTQGINDNTDRDGYFIFDVSDSKCVTARTLTYSGMTTQVSAFNPDPADFYLYNREGYYVYEMGYTTQALRKALGDEISTYNARTGVVEIVNGLFGTSDNFLGNFIWQRGEVLGATITLPESLRYNSDSENIYGEYSMLKGWEWMLDEEAPDWLGGRIEDLGNGEVSITILPIMDVVMKGHYDKTTRQIKVLTSENKNLTEDWEFGTVGLEILKPNYATKKYEVVNEMVATVEDDGSISFGDYAIMYRWYDQLDTAYSFGVTDVTLVRGDVPVNYQLFRFYDNEWTPVGKGQYYDNYMIVKEGLEAFAQDVEVFRNKENQNVYAVKNPYAGRWVEEKINFNTTRNGYYVFDISNPDCVLVKSGVYSGLTLNFGDEEYPDCEDFFFYNYEGYMHYVLEMPVEEIVSDVEARMPEGDSLSDYLSNYDAESHTVNIINGIFGTDIDIIGPCNWQDVAEMGAKIILPDMSGVSEIAVEDSSMPTRIYNLQGIEIRNPRAGEIVIVKRGGKTFKTIVK